MRPTLRGLQLLKDQPLPDAAELLPDLHLARLEVHVLPLEAGRFAEAEPARQRDREERAQTVLAGDLQERRGLLHGERHDRPRRGLRHLHERGRVDRHQLKALRLGER